MLLEDVTFVHLSSTLRRAPSPAQLAWLATPEFSGRNYQPPAAWQTDLAFCRCHISELPDKDGEFIISLCFGRKSPTIRQQAWLTDICTRLRRDGRA